MHAWNQKSTVVDQTSKRSQILLTSALNNFQQVVFFFYYAYITISSTLKRMQVEFHRKILP